MHGVQVCSKQEAWRQADGETLPVHCVERVSLSTRLASYFLLRVDCTACLCRKGEEEEEEDVLLR